MAEELIAQYQWRLHLDEWSPLCDNVLKLDRSAGLTGTPRTLNSAAICEPQCEMCVTAFDYRDGVEIGCLCEKVPNRYSATNEGLFVGTRAESACITAYNTVFELQSPENFGNKVCGWESKNAILVEMGGNPICQSVQTAGMPVTLRIDRETPDDESIKVFWLSVHARIWSAELQQGLQPITPDGGDDPTPFGAVDIEFRYRLTFQGGCFGEFVVPFVDVIPSIPDGTTARAILDSISYPPTFRLKSL